MDIKPVKYWCYKILPLAYDDSLSYYEVLCKLTSKTNELVERVNQYYDFADDITELRSLINEVDGKLTNAKSELQRQIDNNRDSISGLAKRVSANEVSINALKEKDKIHDREIEELQKAVNLINVTIDGWNDYIDSKIKQLDAKLSGQIYRLTVDVHTDIDVLTKRVNELAEMMKHLGLDVYNYSANKRLSLDDNNTKLYIDLENALTAEEYCSLNLSADDYQKQEIRAIDYLRYSKKRLHYDWVYMGISGVRQEISNALTEIYNTLQGTMSADEYAGLDMTAEQYAALRFDNTQYRNYNPNKVAGSIQLGGSGLTSKQYASLAVKE